MPLHRLDFTPDLVAHLRLMGIGGITPGTWTIDGDSAIEAPVDLGGAYVWNGPLHVGAFSYLGANSYCSAARIGRYCSLAAFVQIGMSRHPTDRLTTSPVSWMSFDSFERHFQGDDPFWNRALEIEPYDDRPITTIGNDVWIGAGAFIKDGITIGDGAIIGAHAVVTRDVAPYAIVVGNPGRVLRMRFEDKVVERMLAVRWWRFNLLELKLDLTEPARTLDAIEAAEAAGLQPYLPDPINLAAEARRYRKAQRLLRRAA